MVSSIPLRATLNSLRQASMARPPVLRPVNTAHRLRASMAHHQDRPLVSTEHHQGLLLASTARRPPDSTALRHPTINSTARHLQDNTARPLQDSTAHPLPNITAAHPRRRPSATAPLRSSSGMLHMTPLRHARP